MVYESHEVTIRFNHSDPGDHNAYVFVGKGAFPEPDDSEIKIVNDWGWVIFAGHIVATRGPERIVVVQPAMTSNASSGVA